MKMANAMVALGVLGLALQAGAAEPGRLTVQVDKPGVRISPMLYGIFFEEINCSGDGGLYAELVRNRSLEDSDKPDYWSLVASGNAKADIEVDTSQPLSENNRRALKLSIAQVGEGRAGVANDGYWGMGIKEGARYDLSFYARGDGFKGSLTATLENADGKVYAQAKSENLTTGWKKQTLTLASNATDPKARLVISAAQPGTVWLDVVSLFPQNTFKNRANGLRPNLAEMLADMKPAFVRFPGGCWVEGDTMATASRWKRTVADIADRWTQWNLWGYNSTNGLGFHEYLLMCEDLGAEPLFVINVGMSHKQVVPMNEMGEYVQDALDAIEYCNGPVDSKWGSLRAKNGHPAPFNLKHMEIGNENGGAAYNERYPLFYDAIKAKSPQMHLVACEWGGRPNSRPVEIVDEHYYSTPEFFMRNAHKYDTYDRNRYKVYVGEYAVTQGGGAGNLRGAIGEAAFMTGMERNSDVVVMSSYAPLYANLNHKTWSPDLINFDSSRAYGTPSYWVQQMFGANRGDVVLPVTIQAQEVKVDPQGLRGGIGVGTWLTQAEFKDIKVTQGDKTLFASDLNDLKGWKTKNGAWKAQNGVLQQTSEAENVTATTGDSSWSNYTLSLKARKISGAEGFLILFAVQGDNDYVWWNVGGWGNSQSGLERNRQGEKYGLGQATPGGIEANRWYDIRVEVQGSAFRCYLDGKLISQGTDEVKPLTPIYATASRDEKTGEVILKVVNTASGAQQLRIDVQGVPDVAKAATALVLTGKPEDENTLDAPRKAAPQAVSLNAAGKSFAHTFPGNSVTVLRLKTR